MDSRSRLETLTKQLQRHLPVVPEGALLSDSFLVDLDHPLGAGGQGAVYPGIHAQLELPVAVKVFGAEEAGGDEKLVARFVKEARILAQLNSPHVVRVWDLSRIPDLGYYYFVTEFVGGASLQDCVSSLSRPLVEGEAVAAACACARGLAAMHRAGIIHRDFKPGNALWVADSEIIKVCDLGLAKEAESEDAMALTTMGETFGSPAYMAPEQARGAKDVTPRADVYSLGAILFNLLTGEQPSGMSSLQDILHGSGPSRAEQIEASLEARGTSLRTRSLVLQMLSKKPEDRPADGGEALELLEELMDDLADGDRFDLSTAFADAKRTQPMRVDLTKPDGILWMPPQQLKPNPADLSETVMLAPGGAVDPASKKGAGDKPEPGLETQFWESAFPVLKKERDRPPE